MAINFGLQSLVPATSNQQPATSNQQPATKKYPLELKLVIPFPSNPTKFFWISNLEGP